MSQSGKSSLVSARERAREALVRRAAKQAEREKLLQESLMLYFKAEAATDEARRMLDAAEADKAKAVAQMLSLGEKVSDIAETIGATAAEVRALKKIAAGSAKDADSDEADEPEAETENGQKQETANDQEEHGWS